MEGKFYFILLILSVILPEEIFASQEISSHTHIRKKRLIDHSGSRIVINSINQVPYIVNILNNKKPGHCAGTILSPVDILTASHCVIKPATYHVVSNTILANEGIHHNVTNIKTHDQYDIQTRKNDLALIQISPAIDFVRSGNRPIPLHIDGNPINSVPVTSGWGCIGISPVTHITEFPQKLQSMTLPIINENLCKKLYQSEEANIDDKLICARDPHGLKTSCYGDSGNPLVANNHLLGVMVWSSNYPHPHYPDFFTKVYHRKYAQWINDNKHHRD